MGSAWTTVQGPSRRTTDAVKCKSCIWIEHQPRISPLPPNP